jgi:hypothetical protein
VRRRQFKVFGAPSGLLDCFPLRHSDHRDLPVIQLRADDVVGEVLRRGARRTCSRWRHRLNLSVPVFVIESLTARLRESHEALVAVLAHPELADD